MDATVKNGKGKKKYKKMGGWGGCAAVFHFISDSVYQKHQHLKVMKT